MKMNSSTVKLTVFRTIYFGFFALVFGASILFCSRSQSQSFVLQAGRPGMSEVVINK
jgi:hypothetical protein